MSRDSSTREEILQAIPHRDPFLLVDEIVERTDARIVCTKTFTGQEDFFVGLYPGTPLVPGVLPTSSPAAGSRIGHRR